MIVNAQKCLLSERSRFSPLLALSNSDGVREIRERNGIGGGINVEKVLLFERTEERVERCTKKVDVDREKQGDGVERGQMEKKNCLMIATGKHRK